MANQLESSAYAPEARLGYVVNADVSAAQAESYADARLLQSREALTPQSATADLMAVSTRDILTYGSPQSELDRLGIPLTSKIGEPDASLRWANEFSSLRHLFSYMPASQSADVLTRANQQLKDFGLQYVVDEQRDVHLRTLDGKTDFGAYGRIKGNEPLVLPDGKRFIEPFTPQRQLPEQTTALATDMASDALASAFEGEEDEAAQAERQRAAIDRMGSLISRVNAPGASILLGEANRVLEGSDVHFVFNTSGYAVLLKGGEPLWTLGKSGEPYVPRHWGRKE